MNKLLKLILTDLDGTFLNSQGAYNRDYFLKLWPKLKKKTDCIWRMYRQK